MKNSVVGKANISNQRIQTLENGGKWMNTKRQLLAGDVSGAWKRFFKK